MTRFIKAKLKFYQKASFNKTDYIKNFYLDENENAVIKIALATTADAYSSFSRAGHEELNSEFKGYLDDVIYNIPLRNPVILEFAIDTATKEEKDTLTEKIKNYYGLVLEDKQQDLTINLVTLISLFFVGSGLLLFSYYLASTHRGQYFIDFINIAGTFALWEMVDLYLLDRKTKKVEKMNAGQTATAQIVFV